MNCQEFWESYPELDPAGGEHGHAAECEACAGKLADQRALAAGLRTAVGQWRELEAPARVEAGLIAAFRSQRARHSRPQRVWLPVLTWASAAALLIVLAMLTIRSREPIAPPRAEPAPRPAVQLAAMAADWTGDDDAAQGDFIPLPNAGQAGDSDDLNVVRVEVPRSAMLAAGLRVSADRASELVEADVMLGSDGIARAVRFVNE
ncbi:MAG TPA: hypothetical protein VGS58_21575 [Candidatus Sulfopaludibacter sp.]|nr:hypothetical protein [Candidatus Sulfopaludibacter sp.]